MDVVFFYSLEGGSRMLGEGGWLFILVIFFLMFLRSCFWSRRKYGCWNLVLFFFGLIRSFCLMWIIFRKLFVYDGVGVVLF